MKTAFSNTEGASSSTPVGGKFRRSENTRIKDAVQALALCHNVTPVYETSENSETSEYSFVSLHYLKMS